MHDSDEDDIEVELELSPDQPTKLAGNMDYAVVPAPLQTADDESAIPIKIVPVVAAEAETQDRSRIPSAVPTRRAMGSQQSAGRRTKKSWTKDPTVMLGAAIAAGGAAAIIVGKSVLWMLGR